MFACKLWRAKRPNGRPISGRAGAAPALDVEEAYPPARSTASAGYAADPYNPRSLFSNRFSAAVTSVS
jgi:hypothetical protein